MPSGTETILLVDDDPLVTLVAARALRDLGYEVIYAGNGEDALTLANAHPHAIHLLLADVVMPRMTGPEAASRLRLTQPDIRVIYTSGYSFEADELGGGGFIHKPFTISELAGAVREVLDDGQVSQTCEGAEEPVSALSHPRQWLSQRSRDRHAASELARSNP